MLIWICGLLAAIVLFASLLPLWNTQRAWVRWFDFPRSQVLALCIPTLVFLAPWTEAWHASATTPWIWGVACTAFAIQLAQILPYTTLWRKQSPTVHASDPSRSIRLLTVNVYMDNRNYAHLLNLVQEQRPDVVLAVEVDQAWADAMRPLHPDYPYRLEHPLPNTYGLVFLSRLPLRNARIHYWVQDDIPSVQTQLRLPTGEWVDLYGIHPRPPAPGEADSSKPRDAEVVLVARQVAQHDRPAIVIGDLNDVAWSHTTRLFQRLGRLLDPRVGRGIFPTFHARYWFARWPLDHVFHTRHWGHIQMVRLPAGGSDHFPILAELQLLPPQDPRQQEPEVADHDDHQEANEKVAAAHHHEHRS